MSEPPISSPGGTEPTEERAPRPAEGAGRHETTPFGPPLSKSGPVAGHRAGAGETRQARLPPVPPAQHASGRTDPLQQAPYGAPAPYRQPPYGRPPYGQPWGQPGLDGPPGHPSSPYGTSYQPPYGQQPYGRPPYGQAPYGQAPYGQQPWGPPGMPPPPRKSNRGRIIALVVAGVVVLTAIGVGVWLTLGRSAGTVAAGGGPSRPAPTSAVPGPPSSSGNGPTGSGGAESTGGQGIPPATRPPTGLGDNEALNVFAQQCYQGSMPSCDLLYFATVRNDSVRAYNTYGQTCAGRQPASSGRLCSEAFPG